MSTENTQKRKTFGQKIVENSMLLGPAPEWAGSLALEVKPAIGQVLPRLWTLSPWYSEIKAVVDALNGKELSSLGEWSGSTRYENYDRMLRETRPIFRNIVDAWWKSGPNLQNFRQANPELSADVDSLWKRTPVELDWGDSSNAGFIHTVLDEPADIAYWEAIRFFLLLITNPYATRLAGPCARCGSYYLKKRASQKVYCSRRCGNATTATIRTREHRVQNHADKLRRSRAAIQEWSKTRTKMDWKQWVAKQQPDITSKFLTRAVNNGELRAPVRE